MSEDVKNSEERKSRKTRSWPAITSGEPAESAKRTMFVRETRKHLKRRHEGLAKEQSTRVEDTSVQLAKIEGRIGSFQLQIDELTRAFEAEGLSEIIKKTLDQQKIVLEQKRDAEQALLEAERAKPITERKAKIDQREHDDILNKLEADMKWVLADEEEFERLLGSMQTEYGSWRGDDGVKNLGSYIENIYLEPGAVEKRALLTFSEDPEALPQKLRKQVESEISRIIAERANLEIPAVITDHALRTTLKEALVKQYETAEGRKQIVEKYLAEGVSEGRRSMIDISTPEATMIALREAIFAKGTLKTNEARMVLAALENNRRFNLADADLNILVKVARNQGSDLTAEDRARVDQLSIGNKVRDTEASFNRLLEKERRVGEEFGKFNNLEFEFEKSVAGVDWKKKITDYYNNELDTQMAAERKAMANNETNLAKTAESVTTAINRLNEANATLGIRLTEAPETITAEELQQLAKLLDGARISGRPTEEIGEVRKRVENDGSVPTFSEYQLKQQVESWKQLLDRTVSAARDYSTWGSELNTRSKELWDRGQALKNDLFALGDYGDQFRSAKIDGQISQGREVAAAEFKKQSKPERARVLALCKEQEGRYNDFAEAMSKARSKFYGVFTRVKEATGDELRMILDVASKQDSIIHEAETELEARKASYNPFGREAQVAVLSEKLKAAKSELAKTKKKEKAARDKAAALEELGRKI